MVEYYVLTARSGKKKSELDVLHLASTFDLKSVSSTGNFFQNKKGQTIILESSVHLTFPPLLKTTSGPLLSSNPPRLLLPGVHLLTPPCWIAGWCEWGDLHYPPYSSQLQTSSPPPVPHPLHSHSTHLCPPVHEDRALEP